MKYIKYFERELNNRTRVQPRFKVGDFVYLLNGFINYRGLKADTKYEIEEVLSNQYNQYQYKVKGIDYKYIESAFILEQDYLKHNAEKYNI